MQIDFMTGAYIMVQGTQKEKDALEREQACDRKWHDLSCRVLDIGLESFVVCLEEQPNVCAFSLSFGSKFFCKNRLCVTGAKRQSS